MPPAGSGTLATGRNSHGGGRAQAERFAERLGLEHTRFVVPPVPSPYSLLSVLTNAERASFGSQNISFHRFPGSTLGVAGAAGAAGAAAGAPPASALPRQAVPRHIVQTGKTYAHAMLHHAEWMRSWTELNPEYEYSFFGDEHARRFVERHGTPREYAAFRRILTGSQRADLFRVVFLKVAGGVYADLDEELRRPMRELIGGRDANNARVPRSASAVIGTFWPFEFLVFAPNHPIMRSTATAMSEGILLQVGLQRNRSKHACKSPHECVIRVTGPLAYTSGVGDATHQPGSCHNRLRTPKRGDCADAAEQSLRTMHLCERDAGTIWNSWSCGFARHCECHPAALARSLLSSRQPSALLSLLPSPLVAVLSLCCCCRLPACRRRRRHRHRRRRRCCCCLTRALSCPLAWQGIAATPRGVARAPPSTMPVRVSSSTSTLWPMAPSCETLDLDARSTWSTFERAACRVSCDGLALSVHLGLSPSRGSRAAIGEKSGSFVLFKIIFSILATNPRRPEKSHCATVRTAF